LLINPKKVAGTFPKRCQPPLIGADFTLCGP
jgi:hypothetical protein